MPITDSKQPNYCVILPFQQGVDRDFPFSCCDIDDDVEDPRELALDKVKNATACYAKQADYFHGQVRCNSKTTRLPFKKYVMSKEESIHVNSHPKVFLHET